MSFDQLAPHYRWMETVLAGGVLQKARVAHLATLDNAKHVLIAGSGPGKFLEVLRHRRPELPITVLDRSPAMLREARRHSPGGPTTFLEEDLLTWHPPEAAFDAIVTPCVLDCFGSDTLPRVVAALAMAATANADWLLTDFTLPQSGWRRMRAKLIHRTMYAAFQLSTDLDAQELTPPDPWLEQAGFQLVSRRTFNAGLIHSDHWRRLRKSGETFAT